MCRRRAGAAAHGEARAALRRGSKAAPREIGLEPGRTREDVVACMMLRAGMAVVYREGGAQYDGMMKQYELAEQGAIKAKKGVWSQKNFQKPSEFKAQHK
mmetsp:Transcript_68486/g.222930  ORF Transcript_68486/g.222930 Transcript_68486/m.222930 type:complete len:100 (-) Transcript_68486:83-382(-)